MRLFRPFILSGLLLPEATFRIKTGNKELCLSFDDGPDPVSTPEILKVLKDHNIKALFFCTGQKAENHPELMDLVHSAGHTVGNHGYLHLDGWKTAVNEYIENIYDADRFTSSALFRPPYGHIRLSQYRKLISKYHVVIWDLMPYDFDKETGRDRTLNILKKKIRKGTIITLHDTADSTAVSVLDEFVTFALNEGYNFVIPLFSGRNKILIPPAMKVSGSPGS